MSQRPMTYPDELVAELRNIADTIAGSFNRLASLHNPEAFDASLAECLVFALRIKAIAEDACAQVEVARRAGPASWESWA